MNDFEHKIADFVRSQGLIAPGERVLAAVSGGADSVAMLAVLKRLADAMGFRLAVGHVNHNLRGAMSDGDEEFVVNLAKRLGLAVRVASVDTAGYAAEHKLSTETAARRLRMAELAQMTAELGCVLIATAHHVDDNAETVVHRLMRGTGYRGLGGIWPRKVFASGACCIRPMLCVGRRQIVDYCTENGLDWRHDHTNEEVVYTRNRIRHKLLPMLQQHSEGDLAGKLFRLSGTCQRLTERVEAEAGASWTQIVRDQNDTQVVLDKREFTDLAASVQQAVARRSLLRIGSGERDITREHYRRINELARAARPDSMQLPGGILVFCDGQDLVFAKRLASTASQTVEAQTISISGVTKFGRFSIEAAVLDRRQVDIDQIRANDDRQVEYFDWDSIAGELTVRQRKDGDRFKPIGAPGAKKVGKFLTDVKADDEMRENVVIFEDAKRIIWVAPLRACDQTRVRGKTEHILRIEIR